MTEIENEFDTDVKSGDDLLSSVRIPMLDECVLLIFPRETREMPTNMPADAVRGSDGKMRNRQGKVIKETFKAVFADLILAETPGGTIPRRLREVGVEDLPYLVENFMFSSWQIVANLEKSLNTTKGVFSLVNSRANQYGGSAYGIESFDPRKLDPVRLDEVRALKAQYLERRASNEFEPPKVQDDEPPF